MYRRDGTHLAPELLVDLDISLRAVKGLLQPCEEHGDDDDGLEGLTKHDEEDRNGEDLGSHVGCCCWAGVAGSDGSTQESSNEDEKSGTRTPLDGRKQSEWNRRSDVSSWATGWLEELWVMALVYGATARVLINLIR